MSGAVADVRQSAVAAAAKDGEPDRYLAALLAPPDARDGLLALAAFASELARVPFAVSREPAMGSIRLQWWRDALEMPPELKTGSEIADAMRAAMRDRGIDAQLLGVMVDGRHAALDPEPFADEAALRTFLWETEGTQFAAASHILGSGQAGMDLRPAHVAAGAAYGLARLLAGTADVHALGRLFDVCRLEIEAHMSETRRLTRHLQRNARIAFLPLALVPTYLRAAKRAAASGFRTEPRVTPFARAGRIALAHWLGRL
jgi:phytoene synthase